jgi:hypothetical protein
MCASFAFKNGQIAEIPLLNTLMHIGSRAKKRLAIDDE